MIATAAGQIVSGMIDIHAAGLVHRDLGDGAVTAQWCYSDRHPSRPCPPPSAHHPCTLLLASPFPSSPLLSSPLLSSPLLHTATRNVLVRDFDAQLPGSPSLHHHCTITAPSLQHVSTFASPISGWHVRSILHHHCAITAPSLHHHCFPTMTAPSLHHPCTIHEDNYYGGGNTIPVRWSAPEVHRRRKVRHHGSSNTLARLWPCAQPFPCLTITHARLTPASFLRSRTYSASRSHCGRYTYTTPSQSITAPPLWKMHTGATIPYMLMPNDAGLHVTITVPCPLHHDRTITAPSLYPCCRRDQACDGGREAGAARWLH